ncbi:MAG: hypothetical protein AAAFM81_11910 [Pseudomonadota bacterium]
MIRIERTDLPAGASLHVYDDGVGYCDCYTTELDLEVSLQRFITTFYTTPLFRIERFLLGVLMKKPSNDNDVQALAAGDQDHFAAWTVEARHEDQMLLCDVSSRTRSWLHVQATVNGGARLYFGSAVLPAHTKPNGDADMGWLFRALLGFHKLYAVALLKSATKRLAGRRP